MAFRFKHKDGSVTDAMRRVAVSQLDRGLAEIDGALPVADRPELHVAVHEARKRVKKVRGLLRLVRSAFPEYSANNAALRDAARLLSEFRDHTARIETYEKLARSAGDGIDRRKIAPVRKRLEAERTGAVRHPELPDRIAVFRAELVRVRAEVDDWCLDADGWKAVQKGLKKTYKRARKGAERVTETGNPAQFHEWRKRVKYHRYHARILTEIFPLKLGAHEEAADRLGDMLGDQHDLVELRPVLEQDDSQAARLLAGLAVERRRALEDEALAFGGRLFAEKPGTLADRWGRWWELWRQAEAA